MDHTPLPVGGGINRFPSKNPPGFSVVWALQRSDVREAAKTCQEAIVDGWSGSVGSWEAVQPHTTKDDSFPRNFFFWIPKRLFAQRLHVLSTLPDPGLSVTVAGA